MHRMGYFIRVCTVCEAYYNIQGLFVKSEDSNGKIEDLQGDVKFIRQRRRTEELLEFLLFEFYEGQKRKVLGALKTSGTVILR